MFPEHEEIAKTLIDAGAKLCITDRDNVIPLHSAVAKEDLTIMTALINMGFDVKETLKTFKVGPHMILTPLSQQGFSENQDWGGGDFPGFL